VRRRRRDRLERAGFGRRLVRKELVQTRNAQRVEHRRAGRSERDVGALEMRGPQDRNEHRDRRRIEAVQRFEVDVESLGAGPKFGFGALGEVV
jgi:hypothetical protein